LRSARRGPRSTNAAHDLPRIERPLDDGLGQELGTAGLGRGDPALERLGALRRLALGVEQHGGDVDARDAVDHGVVGLADDREAAALQALHQPELPERLRAVELLGEDARRQHPQLLL
jgi:hypothetical protein